MSYSGKGDRRRKTLVPKEVADANFETIFGKYVPLYMRKQIPDEPLDAYNEERLVSKFDKEANAIDEISKLVADETLQATEPKKEDNK
jgi:hypothetical protein